MVHSLVAEEEEEENHKWVHHKELLLVLGVEEEHRNDFDAGLAEVGEDKKVLRRMKVVGWRRELKVG